MRRLNKKIILYFIFTASIALGAFQIAQAAAYNASDLLGQINQDGTVNWETKAINDNMDNRTGLSQPSAVALDDVNHRLFVYDNGNNRVLVFNLNADNTLIDHIADYVIGQPDFSSTAAAVTRSGIGGGTAPGVFSVKGALAYDSVNDRLFVADDNARRVLVFNVAPSHLANGMDADYEIGQPAGDTAFTSSDSAITRSGFSYIYGIAYDSTNSRLFVAEPYYARRVMVFNVATSTMANGMNADYVLGQSDFTSTSASNTTQSSLLDANLLNYDSVNDRLFVADGNNRRIMVFDVATSTMANGKDADYVLGQANFTSNTQATTQSGLRDSVEDSVYDPVNDRLFVSDVNNHRIMVWDVATSTMANGKNADYVLGQSAFTTRTAATTQGGLRGPTGLAYDSANSRLIVADSTNHRVVVFDVATGTMANGKDAEDVLGQVSADGAANWTTRGANNSSNLNADDTGFYSVRGVGIDTVNHRLFVGDSGNNRVLIFNLNSDNTLIDHIADYVLGQPNFTTRTAAATQSGFYCAGSGFDFAYDSVNSRLFVSDSWNSRVMVFNVATDTMANGKNADYVLGQSDFTSSAAATTQSGLYTSSGLAYDSVNSRLFVGDRNNNRVMVFNVATSTMANGMNADYELGQPAGGTAFTTGSAVTTQSGLRYPGSLSYDSVNSRLFVADSNNYRIMVWDVATSTMANGKDADYVLGQSDFVTKTITINQSSVHFPYVGLSYDSINTRLFVAEYYANRVKVFNVATSAIANGENASAVLGQTSFTSSTAATIQSGLYYPAGLVYDSDNSRLFVSDDGNHRVLLFNLIKLSTTIPSASNGVNYNQALSTSGSQGTLSFALTSGSLPPGFSLNPSAGVISGTPTETGTFSFGITVTDTVSSVAAFTDLRTISLTVNNAPSTGGGLPPSVYNPPATPITGLKVAVNQGANTTLSRIVSLSFNAGADIKKMAISMTGDFSDASQEDYQTTKQIDLCSRFGGAVKNQTCPDGQYFIYVKFYTSWGVASNAVSSSIILKSTNQPSNQPSTAATLIKYPNDPKVYLIEDGQKRWIKDEQTFNSLNYKWSDILHVPISQTYPEGETIAAATLIKYPNDPKVYLIEDGQKRWIKDEQTFNSLNYQWSDIIQIPITQAYPVGDVI